MRYYPAFLDLRERPCVVIGGGAVAERKAVSLLEAGAEVTVISPDLTGRLGALAASGKILCRRKAFEERDLIGAFLAVAATDQEELNRRISALCKAKNILVNVAYPPDEGSFIVPSCIERGDLIIAVSTAGASPALSRKIRTELEQTYGPEYDLLLRKLAALRKRLQSEVHDQQRRSQILNAVVDSDVIDFLREGKVHEADARISAIASEALKRG